MYRQYIFESDDAYQKQMEEVNESIEKQVRAEFQDELSQSRSANSEATFWNGFLNRFSTAQQAERNNQNTQTANENRLNNLEERIQEEINRRSQEQASLMEAEIFEDFGGSREAAFNWLEQHEEEQKAKIENKAEWQFNVASGMQAKKQEQIKSKAYWDFDIASGAQQRKREAIQGQAREDFQEVSQTEEQAQNQETTNQSQAVEEEQATVELKAPEKEHGQDSLDTSFWKQAEQIEAQADTSHLLTTSKESNYDAQMAARITKSFDRAEGKDQSRFY